LRGRIRGGAAFDRAVAVFRFAGIFSDFETVFFSVMVSNLRLKKKKVFGGKLPLKTSLSVQAPLFLW